jgi:hypothetical protein
MAKSGADQLHTIWFCTGFYATALAAGIREVYSGEQSALDWLIPLTLAVCLGSWAIVDAKYRRRSIPTMARWFFVLFAGIVVPGYVIWSRGWRGVGWVAIHLFCWIVLATIVATALGFVKFGAV